MCIDEDDDPDDRTGPIPSGTPLDDDSGKVDLGEPLAIVDEGYDVGGFARNSANVAALSQMGIGSSRATFPTWARHPLCSMASTP